MKKSLPPGVVILVISVAVIVIALWFWKATQGGESSAISKKIYERERRQQAYYDPATGEIGMKTLGSKEAGAAKTYERQPVKKIGAIKQMPD